jgi:hypothetical protein
VSRPDGLVKRGRMTVIALRVVPIRIFTGFQQHLEDLGVAKLRGECGRAMTIECARRRQQAPRIVRAAQSRGDWQRLYARAAPNERLGGRKVPERKCSGEWRRPLARSACLDRGTEIDQRVHKRHLNAGLCGMLARHEHAHRGRLTAIHISQRIDLRRGS